MITYNLLLIPSQIALGVLAAFCIGLGLLLTHKQKKLDRQPPVHGLSILKSVRETNELTLKNKGDNHNGEYFTESLSNHDSHSSDGC